MEDKEFYLMVLVNTVTDTAEPMLTKSTNALQQVVEQGKSFSPMALVKTAHPIQEVSLRFSVGLILALANKF